MTLMAADGRLFYFAHIPKTGGSSVEFAMRAAGARRALHFHKRLDYVRCNLQHMHAELFDTFVPPDFYEWGFCVIRHPVPRLVSEYRWRQELGHVKAPDFDTWVRRQISAYEKNEFLLDNHFRPQVEFIGKKIEVFRFEDGMTSILERVARRTGLGLDTSTHRRPAQERQPIRWSRSTRRMAVEFYRRDFEELGYDPDERVDGLRVTI